MRVAFWAIAEYTLAVLIDTQGRDSTMMGKQPQRQAKLFYYNLCLENRIPQDHLLRHIQAIVDFDFTYDLVQTHYGVKGNVSVPPPVILKLMLLLFLYDVSSERELMRTLPYRLDWLWFLGYDLDSDIPNHSVLSKARRRWGGEVFEVVFTRGVAQCVQAGLVNGRKIHMDGSLVDADASNNSVCKGPEVLIERLRQELRGEMGKLEDTESSPPRPDATEPAGLSQTSEPSSPEPSEPAGKEESHGSKKYYNPKNRGLVSTTDPDAAMVRKGPQGSRARYKHHRAVDDQCGVITAVETTAGDVEENARLMSLVDQHERNTSCSLETVVADRQYGTIENFRACQQRGLISHMADLSLSHKRRPPNENIFGIDQFIYDPASDSYLCPAGQRLTRRKHKKQRQAYEYACAASTCRACSLRGQCTRAQGGVARTIKRHYDQEAIDAAREHSHSAAAQRDRRRRKWLMEGSFADAATHHGFKRSRWRRLWRQRIQDLLIATVQNLRTLVRHGGTRFRGACAQSLGRLASAVNALVTALSLLAELLMPLSSFQALPACSAAGRIRQFEMLTRDRFGQQPVEI
jgi:transposase